MMQIQQNEKLIDRVAVSPADAGILLSVSRPMVYELMNRPDNPIPHFKAGTRTLIPVNELIEWVASQSGTSSV